MITQKTLQELRDATSISDIKPLIAKLIKELEQTNERLEKLILEASKKGIYFN